MPEDMPRTTASTPSGSGHGEATDAAARWAIWPCGHGDVQVEQSRVPPGHQCAECGAHAINVVPETEHRAAQQEAEKWRSWHARVEAEAERYVFDNERLRGYLATIADGRVPGVTFAEPDRISEFAAEALAPQTQPEPDSGEGNPQEQTS